MSFPGERYSFLGFEWDIAAAYKITADGRKPIKLNIIEECLGWIGNRFIDTGIERLILEKATDEANFLTISFGPLTLSHLDHVDPEAPGLLGHLIDQVIILDGHHRAARRWKMYKTDMSFYALTPEESDSLIVDKKDREHISRARKALETPVSRRDAEGKGSC